jgi:glycosyltransferase involved in cell wall biosynthesis
LTPTSAAVPTQTPENQPDGPPDRPLRIVLIHHTIDPNMVPVLARLAATPGLALSVLFASRLPPHRQWPGQADDGFPYKILPKLEANLGLRGAPLVLRANPTVVREIWRAHPDVVISTPFPIFTCLSALLLCRLTRTPFILDIYTMQNRSAVRKALSAALRGIVWSCDGFVAKSTRTIRFLESLGAPPERIFLSPHAVDYEGLRAKSRLQPAERSRLRAEYGVSQPKVVLYVGRLVKRKGIRVLLEAFKQLKARDPDTALVLVGDGYQRRELEEFCASQALRDVHFTGPVPHAKVPLFYGLADLFVLPSIPTGIKVWGEEAWGFVVGEAIACGLPVIATDQVGGSDDLIREGANGHVVPARDVDRLADAMGGILADDGLRARMGQASDQIARQFSYERATEGYRAAIQAVAADRAPGRT